MRARSRIEIYFSGLNASSINVSFELSRQSHPLISASNSAVPQTAGGFSSGQTAAAKPGTAAAGTAGARLGTYTVKSGDTLIGISRKIYGSPKYYRQIAEANKGVIPSSMQLRVGQVIKIPQLPSQSR